MKILKIGAQLLKPSYGGYYEVVHPNEAAPLAPVDSSYFHVPPKTLTKRHMHFESECFVSVQGSGFVCTDNQCIFLAQGDAVQMRPFEFHCFENPSDDNDWVLLSMFWIDRTSTPVPAEPAADSRCKAWIFCAPPTPNGDLHLGHFSGAVLAGEFLVRSLRAQGREVEKISGVDSHLSFVLRQSLQQNIPPGEIAERHTKDIDASLKTAGITYDRFFVPHREADFASVVQRAMRFLLDAGHAVAVERDDIVCSTSGAYLPTALVEGECPHCGAGTVARECEVCGTPNFGWDLLRARSLTDGQPPAVRKVRALTFSLQKWKPQIIRWASTLDLPLHAAVWLQQELKRPWDDFVLAYPGDCGFALDDMQPGLISNPYFDWILFNLTLGHPFEGRGSQYWKDVWSRDEDEKIFCIGFDNLFDHLILQSALHLALWEKIKLPRTWIVNEFMRLSGEKFSTSRNHVERVATFAHAQTLEPLKFYLLYQRPEGVESNFERKEFLDFQRRVFGQKLKTCVGALHDFIVREPDRTSPTPGAWRYEDKAFYEDLQAALETLLKTSSLRENNLRAYAQRLARLVEALEAYVGQIGVIHGHEQLHDEYRTKVALALTGLQTLLVGLHAAMPEFTSACWSAFGFRGGIGQQDLKELKGRVCEYLPLTPNAKDILGHPVFRCDGKAGVHE